MIFHIMKDGTRRDSIDGYIVKYEQKKELYKRLKNLKVVNKHDNSTSTRIINQEQVSNR